MTEQELLKIERQLQEIAELGATPSQRDYERAKIRAALLAGEAIPLLVVEVRRLGKVAVAWEDCARSMGDLLDDIDIDVEDDEPTAKAWATLRALGVEP